MDVEKILGKHMLIKHTKPYRRLTYNYELQSDIYRLTITSDLKESMTFADDAI